MPADESSKDPLNLEDINSKQLNKVFTIMTHSGGLCATQMNRLVTETMQKWG